jgi:predicted Zn-dependent peptidase
MEVNYFELKNGIRVIHKTTKSNVAHCGFIINTGSRDEMLTESGMTHFIEHAIFKGTEKRKAYHILNRIDNVGGEINAYTTKENTSIYASFLKTHIDRATELLTDILFNSTYPEKELEKEKDVIIDEIYSYQDTPFEQIYDDFEELIYKNHPLSMNILGSVETVKKINRKNILSFIAKYYATNEIVFSVVGDFSATKIKKLADKYLGNIPMKISTNKRKVFSLYSPNNQIVKKDVLQTHCMIGNIAYGAHHKNKNGFILLNNILGGPAMNSRLNMGIREKYGFTYNIESSYTVYSDTGLFNIYLGTDSKHIDKSIQLVNKELKKLRDKKLSSTQLHKSKQQLIGQIALSDENNCNVMLGMGKSLLLYNKVDDLKVTHDKINAITAEQLQDISNEIFNDVDLSSLIYQPIK